VGILKQIQGRIKDTGSTSEFSLDALLNKLRDAGMTFSPEDFREISKTEPVSNIISNIKGDKVIFVGQVEEPEEQGPDEAKKTIDKMSKKAAKKPQL
jgi:hypothetical protein